ncbi:hypothetical protein QOT17_000735 [Balamuthia mandrillaris]
MKRSGASGGSRSNGRPVIDLNQLRDKELGEEEIVTLLTKGTEVDPTWEGGIGPGLYRFRGTETCDDGFVYQSENELTLLEDGTLEGGFVFKSSDGTFFSPLKGTWNEEGELYWLLPYVDVIYEYSGKWEGKRSKGRYHVHNEPNCFPGMPSSAAYSCCCCFLLLSSSSCFFPLPLASSSISHPQPRAKRKLLA